MKTKKFLILAILVVVATMFFTGCSYNITNEYKESQKVAEDFLTTKGYEPPQGYTIRYLGEGDKQLCVKVGKTEIVFDISEGKPEMVSIKDVGTQTVSISKACINEIEEVGYSFLNTIGYRIPEGYSIKYLGESKAQLEVEKDEENTKITVTFNIVEEQLGIENIKLYIDEGEKGPIIITIFVVMGIFMACLVILVVVIDKKEKEGFIVEL